MSAEQDPGQPDRSGTGKPMSRRLLLKGAVGVAGAAAAARGTLVGEVAQAASLAKAAPPPALRFLTQFEFEYLTAMAETIWPTDDLGPGARVAGVGQYIDGQLAGSWGQGHRLYLNGPFFQPETSGHGWQIPMTPADVYRAFLPGFDVYCKRVFGQPYPSLQPAQQTQALTDLQTGKAPIQIGGSTVFTSADFFSLFRQNVLEGMLADPAYGGNRDMVGWKWIGFPGDPMRRGDVYEQYIFNNKPYPFAGKPLPLAASSLKAAAKGAAAPAAITKPSTSTKGGM
jgi:gluconate 2-dehydrogenase gamma chain